MFVNVGRFRFRPMGDGERQGMIQRIAQDVPPVARQSPGFRGVYFARPSDDEVMAVWLWDSAADWEAIRSPRHQTTPAAFVFDFDGGRLVENRHYFDLLTFLRQIGAA